MRGERWKLQRYVRPWGRALGPRDLRQVGAAQHGSYGAGRARGRALRHGCGPAWCPDAPLAPGPGPRPGLHAGRCCPGRPGSLDYGRRCRLPYRPCAAQ
eukprot:11168162-Lingulodinium_polyedra.AAC.1